MKSCLMASLFMAPLMLIPMAGAAGVTRSLSSEAVQAGGTLTVTLRVNVSGAGDHYAIDEMFPRGWRVSDAGGGSTEHDGHWKYVTLEGARDTLLDYALTAPGEPGTYRFSGEYMFGGMEDAEAIQGQDTVSVVSPATGIAWLPAAALAVVAAMLIALKKFRG
jgi:hypothetical protein